VPHSPIKTSQRNTRTVAQGLLESIASFDFGTRVLQVEKVLLLSAVLMSLAWLCSTQHCSFNNCTWREKQCLCLFVPPTYRPCETSRAVRSLMLFQSVTNPIRLLAGGLSPTQFQQAVTLAAAAQALFNNPAMNSLNTNGSSSSSGCGMPFASNMNTSPGAVRAVNVAVITLTICV